MRRHPRLVAVVTLVVAAGIAGVPARRLGPDVAAVSHFCGPGTTQSVSVPDPTAPQEQRRVVVHRPPGPDRADIPVLYLLHGFPGDPQSLLGGLAGLLDAQMCRTGRPFVVAAPDGVVAASDGSDGGIDTEWGDDAAGRFALESFVTSSAIAAVEGSHRRSRALRAIGGYSMGGYGAAATALRHPQLYSQVAAFGGYYRLDDPAGVFAGDDADHAPDQLVGSLGGAPARQLRFFLVEGVQENTALQVGSIRGEADRFAAILHGNGVTVSVAHPPGGHDAEGWNPALGDCVDFLTAGWAP